MSLPCRVAFKFKANVVEKSIQKSKEDTAAFLKQFYLIAYQLVIILGLQGNGSGNGGKRGKCPSKNQVDFGLEKGIAPFAFGNFPAIHPYFNN